MGACALTGCAASGTIARLDVQVGTRHLTGTLPDDDLARIMAAAALQDRSRSQNAQTANAYAVLISGAQTNGRYCLLELVIPPGSGPPLHRHDFEELFILLEGEIEFTVRGEPLVVSAPHAVNVPANAPHRFSNNSGKPAHLLCMCTPAGLEEFFEALDRQMEADRAAPRSADQSPAEHRKALTRELAAQYRMELLER